MAKESPLCQDVGPKKYKQIIERNSKDYDKYKAGKRDPKTGEVYRHISTTNPNKKTSFGQSLGCVECLECNEPLSIKTSTLIVICGRCGLLHRLEHNREDKSFTIEASPIKKDK